MKNRPPFPPDTRHPTPDTYFGEFVTHSPEETFEMARSIGESLTGPEIFLLRGDLGAGKTVFAKGLAAGLGIPPEDVTSPSFTLINLHEGRLRFYHVDLYRLEGGATPPLGLEEMFEEPNAVVLVEWAERLGFVPARAIDVELHHLSDCERKIVIT